MPGRLTRGLAVNGLVAVLALSLPDPAPAVVMLNCGDQDSPRGPECRLDELLAGRSFTINDKRFSNWALEMGPVGGRLADATKIDVDPLDSRVAPGFVLNDVGNTLQTLSESVDVNGNVIAGIESPISVLRFDVAVITGERRIKDVLLMAAFGQILDVSGFADADVIVDVMDDAAPPNLLATATVECLDNRCGGAARSASKSFERQRLVHVEVFSGVRALDRALELFPPSPLGTTQPPDFAEIDLIVLRVSQVPAPAALVC